MEKTSRPPFRSTIIADRVVALCIVAVTAVFLMLTFGEVSAFARNSAGRGPYFFPRLVLIFLLIAESFLLANVFSPRGAVQNSPRPTWRVAWLVLATAAYCALIQLAGFLIASILFGIAVPLLLGRRTWITIMAVALVYSIAVWLLFERVFLIILPASPFDIGF
ncbi:tripartite tricarboxylate transporter TctB family protein [Sulfitobacter sp. PR48]|uniref:tripartite tricarboxylate transporter TctB family protein n=1 Tax=Sulfitobacter sp. PR48 TaxID=3028383 RepID=UPI00237C26B1|nr:tripartite tricarboxylate transporter TctB family protein [Sulfitobacter sp. PR48]MDD9720677.1 tripartite tricarboxylate transporter TctB family protein [Sulfitobacter sp. PR48]